MSIAELRLRNQLRYAKQLNQPSSATAATATYSERSTRTGLRRVILPDGGVAYGRFNSNSQPESFPLFVQGGLGQVGAVDQKPVG